MRVGVVGAGIGGLAVGARLARAGIDVEILESQAVVGGKMRSVQGDDGLRWDTGPTLITLPDEIHVTFADLAFDGGVAPTLLPLDHGTRVHFVDGSVWNLPAPGQSLATWFENIDSRTAREVGRLMEVASDVYAFARGHVLEREPPGLMELGLKTTMGGLALRHPDLARLNFQRFVEKHLTDPRARELFLHFASYVGILPENATASLVSVAHVEFALPVVFPQGGVYEVARWLEGAARAHGAKLQLDARVLAARPLGGVDDTKARGWEVTLEGENVPRRYDTLVVGADPHQALVDWLDVPTLRRHWYGDVVEGRLAPGESQFVVLFDRGHDESPLAHHEKIFPESWTRSYRETHLHRGLPSDPCVYLVWPHATDPTVSARVLFLSAMAPSLDSGHSWDASESAAYAEVVLSIARSRLGRALPGRVVDTLSPMDLYRRTGSLRGGLYGAAPTRYRPAAFARPSTFSKVPRLHFVGGGVHPGAGVPMVLKGARRVAANVISQGG